MGRKLLSYDEEIDMYLTDIINSLHNAGIRNASKTDALRFIIKQNQEVKVRFKRKRNGKQDVKDVIFF